MTELGLWPLIQFGLVAGFLHSLDADHLAAVGGMASRQSNPKSWPVFSLRWAMGHGAAIILISAIVLLLGAAIPHQFSALAEGAVAYMLIAIGLLSWWQLIAEHRGSPRKKESGKAAAFIGLIHGSAGSAPLLALLPAAATESFGFGMTYILLFCISVVLAMLGLGQLMKFSLLGVGQHLQLTSLLSRGLFASLSIIVGIYLML